MPDQLPDIEQYRARCEQQATLLENLTKANSALTATVEALHQTIDGLHGTIGELKETIRDLQSKLNRNSQNSSQPPSKDGFNKPQPRSQRAKTGRKPGGQAGHAGMHMAVPHEPDEVRSTFLRNAWHARILPNAGKREMSSPVAKSAMRWMWSSALKSQSISRWRQCRVRILKIG